MMRLDEALAAVRDGLEPALQAAMPRLDAPYVVLGNPAEANAKYGETSKGRFLLTLAGLHLSPERRASAPIAAGGLLRAATGLEADLLLTADFPGQYLKGIRMMAAALDWMCDNPVLTASNAAAAGESSQIAIVLAEPTLEEAAALVDMAGVKGCPFALLRVRGLGAGAQAVA